MRYTKQLIELQNIKSNNCKSTVVRSSTLKTHMKIYSTNKYIEILLYKNNIIFTVKASSKNNTDLS